MPHESQHESHTKYEFVTPLEIFAEQMEIWHHIFLHTPVFCLLLSCYLSAAIRPKSAVRFWFDLIYAPHLPTSTGPCLSLFNQVSAKRLHVLKQQFPRQLCVCMLGKNLLLRPKRNNLKQSHWAVLCSVCFVVSWWALLAIFIIRKHYTIFPVSNQCHVDFFFTYQRS